MAPEAPIRFLCDAMLGHVARWLRLAGFDTEYAEHQQPDDAILARAQEEDRVLLTRDDALHRRAKADGRPTLLLEAAPAGPTLAAVFEALDIPVEDAKWFSRCTRCNGALQHVPRESVKEKVPGLVYERNQDFRACTACGQVYWEGTHVANIRDVLQALTKRGADAPK